MGNIEKRTSCPEFTGEQLSRVAFPLGGIGAGMVCVEGGGALSHVSVRNEPDVFCEPLVFAAVKVKEEGCVARVLEGPVPGWKVFGSPDAGNGAGKRAYGFPRFERCTFKARFPFAEIEWADDGMPLRCGLKAWSPFEPNVADDASLPMGVLEYEFANRTNRPLEAVFSFHAGNFMAGNFVGPRSAGGCVKSIKQGFVLHKDGTEEAPADEGDFAVMLVDERASVDCAWFRGGWFDARSILWKNIDGGQVVSHGVVEEGDPSPGGSVYLPMQLGPGERKTATIVLTWYVAKSTLRTGDPKEADSCCCGKDDRPRETHVPWYAKRFGGIEEVVGYARENLDRLREESKRFSDCFYDTDLPSETIEAIAANLTILKSPTVLRQGDGRLWCWEGCCDGNGCCYGSCTHVWNYAQALPHLFAGLERTLRQTEFNENQNEAGHQGFRACLPIREMEDHSFHSAADGQLGGIMKAYREWRISGDDAWLKAYWPRVVKSLDYCIGKWDPKEQGILCEPHHNTYDIEFWGPDGMCTSFYLGALKAAGLMAGYLGEDGGRYEDLYRRGRAFMEGELYNGEYFIQKIQWEGLEAGSPLEGVSWTNNYSPEAVELLEKEGPKYQYGEGCLSDGVLGAWMAEVCGVGEILDKDKVRSHLLAVHRYNLKQDLWDHANPQRPSYAMGQEGGLLLCTWPRGGELSLPFIYSNEVWTGIEYQVAGHLMMMGCVDEGLEIVRVARSRYDGRVRNPFNEYECGHWYARAMSSYSLLQGLTGIRYDAVEKVLHVQPRVRGDFRSFISTASGYGTAGVVNGKPFVEVKQGTIDIARTVYTPYSE